MKVIDRRRTGTTRSAKPIAVVGSRFQPRGGGGGAEYSSDYQGEPSSFYPTGNSNQYTNSAIIDSLVNSGNGSGGGSESIFGRAGSLGGLGGGVGRYYGGQSGGEYGGLGGQILGTALGNRLSGGDFGLSAGQTGGMVGGALFPGNPYAGTVGSTLFSLANGDGINPGNIVTGLGLRALGPVGAGLGLVGGYTGATRYVSDAINNGIDSVAGTRFGSVARDSYAVQQMNGILDTNSSKDGKLSNEEMLRDVQRQNETETYGYSTQPIDNLRDVDTTIGQFAPSPFDGADFTPISMGNVDTTVGPFSSMDAGPQSVYSETGPEWNGSDVGFQGNGMETPGGFDWGTSPPYDRYSGNYDGVYGSDSYDVDGYR